MLAVAILVNKYKFDIIFTFLLILLLSKVQPNRILHLTKSYCLWLSNAIRQHGLKLGSHTWNH